MGRGRSSSARGVIEDANSDSNFCAYIATGVWHHVLATGDDGFAERMWPTVRAAIDFVLGLQLAGGEICWARSPSGLLPEALLTGSASIYQSIRCALALANHLDEPQPEWEVAVGRLGHAIVAHPEAFTEKPHHSMEWYYPILGGALRGPDGRRADRRALGGLRGQRAGHPLRRRSTLGHRRRDLRTGADAGGDGRPRPCARAVRQHATPA